MTKKILFLLLAGCFAVHAFSQSVWNPLNSGSESNLYAVDFIDELHGLAVGAEGTILKTSDGGNFWQLIDAGIFGPLLSVDYIDAQQAIITGGNGLILKTTDAGDSWQQVPSNGVTVDLLGLDMLPSGSGLACGLNQTVLWTTNGGDNWEVIRTDYFGSFTSAHILNDTLAFVYGENSIFNHLVGKITMGGDSLDFSYFYINNNGTLTEGIINAGYHFNEDSCVTAGAIFPGAAAITCNRPWGQTSWEPSFIMNEFFLAGLDFAGDYGVSVGGAYAGGDPNIIIESYDKGHNWEIIPQTTKKDGSYYAVKLIGDAGYIVGDGGLILKKEGQPQQPWTFTVTGQAHTINVPVSAFPNIFGQPLEEGDWVGVFFAGVDGVEMCGGAAMIDQNGAAVVIAYGDDATTSEKDGFTPGETFRWRIFDATEQTEYPAGATYDDMMPNQEQFADFGLSKLTSLEVMYCRYYSLAQGWNSMSGNILPFDAAVENIFAPVGDQLTIVRNLTSVYWPGENINTIGDFDNDSGYAVKTSGAADFSICGIGFSSPELTLSPGWHYLPVLSECSVNVMELFGAHLSDLIIIQDLIGTSVFWPEMGIY
ncbi:MAG: WD40/YVTN/BNR-like repeat-containing protein, partial [Bacteroidales bacterium]